jgi:Cd2+/Zn2+-exporting ATPase
MLAGVLHTLTGPDHLAALAPLTIGRSRAQSTLLGGLWGCGHNTGQILFGMVFLVLRDRLSMNMELISQWGQGVVGVTLVLIGMLGFKEAMELDDAAAESAREVRGLPSTDQLFLHLQSPAASG